MSKNETNSPDKNAGFLNRWSSRKREESASQQRVEVADAPEPVESASTLNLLNAELDSSSASDAPLVANAEPNINERSLDAAEEATEEQEPPLLSDADMPALETLTAKSDLSDFFNKGVSASLRRAALRHVFSLPIYNVRDGLNDYDDDYTKFEPLGDTVTSDMKWHKARKEREAEERLAAEEEERKRLAENEADADSDAEEEVAASENEHEHDEAQHEKDLVQEQEPEHEPNPESLDSEESQDIIQARDEQSAKPETTA